MGQYRKERLGSLIRTVVSSAIAHRLHDPRLEPLTTVTRVELSADLAMARVYVSVPGDTASERRTEKALQQASGFIRKLLAQELTIRHCPELHFSIDTTIKKVQQTMELLDEINPTLPATETWEDEAAEAGFDSDEQTGPDEAPDTAHDEAMPESKD